MELSQSHKALNLDANASFGLLPEVLSELREQFPLFLNPSSIHRGGQAARAILDEARSELGDFLGLSKGDRIVFTSGATESNNTALRIPFRAVEKDNAHLVISAVEHPSVLEAALELRSRGIGLSLLRPSGDYTLLPEHLTELVAPKTKLVSVMLANNETGHLYPIAELSAAARNKNPQVLLHTDAVQALGKVPLRFPDCGVDLMSLSAHKIGGLSGIGALIVSENVPHEALLFGGPQEARWRAGTENVVGVLSFGIAVRNLRKSFEQRVLLMRSQRDMFLSSVTSVLKDVRVNSKSHGLPNTLSLTIPNVRADDLVVALDMEGVLISSGAACASGKPEPSHVLMALGLSPEEARSSVRVSFTGMLTEQELQQASAAFTLCVQRMRGEHS
ncbi:MAG: cysteine desulfurase [Deltaproteobacteria bacterium]|nr:cysteine desulfurase [Deltaproteobacteria bacterium]